MAEEKKPRTLANDEAVAEAEKHAQGKSGVFLKIPAKGRTPLYLLPVDFSEGFVHWVHFKESKVPHRVVCGGGIDGGGMDTDNCPICGIVMEKYKAAKAMRGGSGDKKVEAKILKEAADKLKAKFEFHCVAVQGMALTKEVPDPKSKKMVLEYSARFAADGDQPMQVGVLSLSSSQLTEIKNTSTDTERFPWMTGPQDRMNRVIWGYRGKSANTGKEKVLFVPSKHTMACPVDKDAYKDISVEKDFDVNRDDLQKTYMVLIGKADVDTIASDADTVAADVELGESEGEEGAEGTDLSDVGDDFLDDDPAADVASGAVTVTKEPKKRAAPAKAVKKTPQKAGRGRR